MCESKSWPLLILTCAIFVYLRCAFLKFFPCKKIDTDVYLSHFVMTINFKLVYLRNLKVAKKLKPFAVLCSMRTVSFFVINTILYSIHAIQTHSCFEDLDKFFYPVQPYSPSFPSPFQHLWWEGERGPPPSTTIPLAIGRGGL
jgi:hypothetical protein